MMGESAQPLHGLSDQRQACRADGALFEGQPQSLPSCNLFDIHAAQIAIVAAPHQAPERQLHQRV
jgi:hypothetical protein